MTLCCSHRMDSSRYRDFFTPFFDSQSKRSNTKLWKISIFPLFQNLPILTICTIPLSITPQPRSSIPRTIAVSSPPGTHMIAHICSHFHPYPAFSKTSHPVYPPTQCEWRAICGHRKEMKKRKLNSTILTVILPRDLIKYHCALHIHFWM